MNGLKQPVKRKKSRSYKSGPVRKAAAAQTERDRERQRDRESTCMEQHTDTVTCKFKAVRPKHVVARPATQLLQD